MTDNITQSIENGAQKESSKKEALKNKCRITQRQFGPATGRTVYDLFLLFSTLAYGLLLLLIKVIFNGTQGLEEVQPGPFLCGLFCRLAGRLGSYYYICWRKQGRPWE